MAACSGCKESLKESLVAEDGGNIYKSCPKCSADAGYHIFYKYEEFGMRNMGDGREIVQSYCPSCRLPDGQVLTPVFTC